MGIISSTEKEDLKEAHDYHFDCFLSTKEFRHFEAAKAIAAKIISYEYSVRGFEYAPELEKMYFFETCRVR